MGQGLRKSLRLAQCAAIAIALLFLGFAPASNAAVADDPIDRVVVENLHSQQHGERGRIGDGPFASGHCHPGLDCYLVAVMADGAALIARPEHVTREPGFIDLALLGGEPSFDPPPPRRVSWNAIHPIGKPIRDTKDKI